MLKKLITFIKTYRVQLLIAGVSLACYLIFVYAGRHFFTHDTVVYQMKWWDYLAQHGWRGIATLNDPATGLNGDYTTIWYAIIVIFTKLQLYPQFPIEFSIKLIAVFASLLSAAAIFFIAKHFRPKSPFLPVIAASMTPFLPLFSMDLLKTNLTDSLFIAFCLWSFYFFVRNKKGLAWFLVALGACFKPMAVYLVPVFIFFYIKDFATYTLREKLAPLWGIPAVVLCSIPHVLAGGSFLNGIINPILGRNDTEAVMPWFWLIPTSNNFTSAGVPLEMKSMLYGLLFFVIFMTMFFILKYVKKENQTRVGLAILPTISIMMCFYLLPSQHETYFAMAGIFALVGFFILPNKLLFVNVVAINSFLFCMYLFGLTWWLETPTRILPNEQMGVLFVGLIIFNYYLLYRYSVFYKLSKSADNI